MKNQLVALLWGAILLSACTVPPGTTSETRGRLVVGFSNQIGSRTITPSLSMLPATYTVNGTGPEGAQFLLSSSGAAVQAPDLPFGEWTLLVNALNADGTLIGTGTTSVQVLGPATQALVQVLPVAGHGSLSVAVTWPEGEVLSPVLRAALIPTLGKEAPLSVSINGNSGSFFAESLGSGYYTLTLSLLDGTTLVAGAVDVVRIVADQQTSGHFSFENINAVTTGLLQVGIVADLQDPLAVTIGEEDPTVFLGSSTTLQASAATALNVVYLWYVNGEYVGSGDSLTWGQGKRAGYYTVDVTAFAADGTRAGSARRQLRIVPVPAQHLVGVGTPLDLTASVTTLAGLPQAGYVDGSGPEARFFNPNGVATDGVNVYVTDATNRRIRRISPSGEVTTLAGSGLVGFVDGPAGEAQFSTLAGIASDGVSLFVADIENCRIRRIDIATGAVSTLAGSGTTSHRDGPAATAGIPFPGYVATDGVWVYVADSSRTVRRISIATGWVTTIAGSQQWGNVDGIGREASFGNFYGIATDGASVFVASDWRIRKIDLATRNVTTLAGNENQGAANGTGTEASFYLIGGLATDGTVLYVTDDLSNQVREVVIDTGVVTTLAGALGGGVVTADGVGPAARFNGPRGIATDGTRLYVADTSNHQIRQIE